MQDDQFLAAPEEGAAGYLRRLGSRRGTLDILFFLIHMIIIITIKNKVKPTKQWVNQ